MKRWWWLGVLLVAAGVGGVWFLLRGRQVAPAPLGDYGDAPDTGLEVGYYDAMGGARGVMSQFTVGFATRSRTIPENVGLFTRDGSLFIDNLTDIPPHTPPSLERGTLDATDPDLVASATGCSNNTPKEFIQADRDRENAQQPYTCPPADPLSPLGAPNALLIIVPVALPPLAMFVTGAYSIPGFTAGTPAFWNVLFDQDQDGDWSGGAGTANVGEEWIVENQPFTPVPGVGTLLASSVFRFGTKDGWGVLAFPMWVRNVLSTQNLGYTHWDGSGPRSGLAVGEVEDTFFEWRALGQQHGAGSPQPERLAPDSYPKPVCPAAAARDGGVARVTCEIPAVDEFDGVFVACLSGADTRAATTGTLFTHVTAGAPVKACGGFAPVTATLAGTSLTVEVGATDRELNLLLAMAPRTGNTTVGFRIAVPR